jgi:hypothetical protein
MSMRTGNRLAGNLAVRLGRLAASVAVLAAIIFLLATANPPGVGAQAPTVVRANPGAALVGLGQTQFVDILVQDVQRLYGSAIYLSFDPAVVEVAEMSPGSFPIAENVLERRFDNSAGAVDYAAHALNPSPESNGTGVMVRVSFRGKALGQESVIGMRGSPTSILAVVAGPQRVVAGPFTWESGTISVTLANAAVDGLVGLQGRTQGAAGPIGWGGATVRLTCSSGPCAGQGAEALTTDARGAFGKVKNATTMGLVHGVYTAVVSHAGYLPATRTGVNVSGDLAVLAPATGPQSLLLLGGDANNDGVINMLDLTTMGTAFNQAPIGGAGTGADINGDNRVNVLDVVMTGNNYGKTASPW